MNADLLAQVNAIRARTIAIASNPSSTAEDLAWLAKVTDAIGGKTTIFDIMEMGDTKKAEITALALDKTAAFTALAGTKTTDLTNLGDSKMAAVTAAGTTQITNIVNAGSSVLRTKITAADASPIVLNTAILKAIELTAPASLAFQTITITLPDATALTTDDNSFTIKNKSWCQLLIKNASGTTLVNCAPRAWAKFSTQRLNANDWAAYEAYVPMVKERPFLDMSNGSYGGRYRVNGFTFNSTSGFYPYSSCLPIVPILDAVGNAVAMVLRSLAYNGSTYCVMAAILNPVTAPNGYTVPASWSSQGGGLYPCPPLRHVAAFIAPQSSNVHYLYGITKGGVYNDPILLSNGLAVNGMTSIAFGKGEYLVICIAFSNSTKTILRFKVNADGTMTAAGSLSVNSTVGWAQVSDTTLMIYDGSSATFYDMTAAGTTLVAANAFADATLGMQNLVGIHLGDNIFTFGSGVYKYNGGNSYTKIAAITTGYTVSASTFVCSYPTGDGQAVSITNTSTEVLICLRCNGAAVPAVFSGTQPYNLAHGNWFGFGGLIGLYNDKALAYETANAGNVNSTDVTFSELDKISPQFV